MSKRVVIIGGGPAGYEAAFAGTKYGAEVTLIEDQGSGGSAVLYDCVPSKSLIAATGIRTDLRRADDMGFEYERKGKFLEISSVNARVRDLARAQSADVRAQLESNGARLISGRGYFKESPTKKNVHAVHVDHADGTEEVIECELVLIATGAHPRVLPGAEPDGERILSWRQVYDLQELPEHLIVVGSGVTGAEFVSAFAELGLKVTMCASRDRILPHDDADAADTLEAVLSERGVHLEKNCRVSSVTRTDDGGVKVTTQDGREIYGSHALLTVGSIPNTDGLGLEEVAWEP